MGSQVVERGRCWSRALALLLLRLSERTQLEIPFCNLKLLSVILDQMEDPPYLPNPSSLRFFRISSSSLAPSACCTRSDAVSRFIFSSNGSPSSSCASAPT